MSRSALFGAGSGVLKLVWPCGVALLRSLKSSAIRFRKLTLFYSVFLLPGSSPLLPLDPNLGLGGAVSFCCSFSELVWATKIFSFIASILLCLCDSCDFCRSRKPCTTRAFSSFRSATLLARVDVSPPSAAVGESSVPPWNTTVVAWEGECEPLRL